MAVLALLLASGKEPQAVWQPVAAEAVAGTATAGTAATASMTIVVRMEWKSFIFVPPLRHLFDASREVEVDILARQSLGARNSTLGDGIQLLEPSCFPTVTLSGVR
jgi:hypothetical protein